VFCDSDWAGDSETRISVTGFILYLMNVPLCLRSKSQKGVTLSSSEAEYVAMSEVVKEVKFINYLPCNIGIEVELPIIVKTDNVGAKFMAQNSSSGVRTRLGIILSERILIKELLRLNSLSPLGKIQIFYQEHHSRNLRKTRRNDFWRTILKGA
jgi:hypothetical protein